MSSLRRKRRSPEQIIAHLREADGMLSAGQTIGQVCQKLGISEQTYHRWRNTFGGMKGDAMKRLKRLEEENHARILPLSTHSSFPLYFVHDLLRQDGPLRRSSGASV